MLNFRKRLFVGESHLKGIDIRVYIDIMLTKILEYYSSLIFEFIRNLHIDLQNCDKIPFFLNVSISLMDILSPKL